MTESKTSFSRYWIISRYLSLPIFKFIYFELRKVLRRKESSWYHVGKTKSRDMEKESHIDLIVPIIKWATFWIVSIRSRRSTVPRPLVTPIRPKVIQGSISDVKLGGTSTCMRKIWANFWMVYKTKKNQGWFHLKTPREPKSVT